MPYIDFCNIKILQDDEGNWWLEYYLDDIRYGVSLADIHAAQHRVQADIMPCPRCKDRREIPEPIFGRHMVECPICQQV